MMSKAAGSGFLVKLSYEAQDFFDKITPQVEMPQLLPESDFVFQLIPTVFVVSYLMMLIFFPAYQRKNNILSNLKIRQSLFFTWNVFLTIYSGISFVFVFTWFVVQMSEKGSFWIVYCPTNREEVFTGSSVVWFYAFAISKYFELLDTFFLILKNPDRKPMFLHWFHHATMVYCTWWFCRYYYSLFFFGMLMNTFVHTNMYMYYALTVFFKAPWAPLLTLLQILQMFVGIIVNTAWLYHYHKKGCVCDHPYLMPGYMLLLGWIYMYLFIVYMFKRYFGFGKKKRKKSSKKKN